MMRNELATRARMTTARSNLPAGQMLIATFPLTFPASR
jgi:hypothetical protein